VAKPSILPSGMKLVGDVSGEEDFVVFGLVEGEVHVDGTVVVEQSGIIRGNVRGRTVTVRGVVVGDASADASIRVDDGGKMVGDVRAPRVNIVKGARFRGHVHMVDAGGEPAAVPSKKRRRRKRHSRRPDETAAQGPSASSGRLPAEPTVPGTLRAAQKADTVVGDAAPDMHRRPPAPRMPVLRRSRARRKDSPA